MESDKESLKKSEFLSNSIPSELMYYRTCLSLSDGNIGLADEYYYKDIVEVYEKLAVKKSLEYPYIREENERFNDKNGF